MSEIFTSSPGFINESIQHFSEKRFKILKLLISQISIKSLPNEYLLILSQPLGDQKLNNFQILMTVCEPVGFIGEKFVVRQFLSESLCNKYLKICAKSLQIRR